VREATWLRDVDLKSLSTQFDISPTVSVRDAYVQDQEFEKFIDHLSQ
jgi:hypothetical protein